mgnify:CR=1 FL=1
MFLEDRYFNISWITIIFIITCSIYLINDKNVPHNIFSLMISNIILYCFIVILSCMYVYKSFSNNIFESIVSNKCYYAFSNVLIFIIFGSFWSMYSYLLLTKYEYDYYLLVFSLISNIMSIIFYISLYLLYISREKMYISENNSTV